MDLENKDSVLELIEFETKYEVEADLLHPFKALMDKKGFITFLYVEGPDIFFTKKDSPNMFARYRKAAYGEGPRAEFTIKEKHSELNNIIRTETNWRVDGTPYEEILKATQLLGLEYNTSIHKFCHIYKLQDATLVFYTVRSESQKFSHFIEIEVSEELDLTETQAWSIIRKYEDLLAPLGINPSRRKKKSLFEMFRKQ